MTDEQQAIREKVRALGDAIRDDDNAAALSIGLDLLADFLMLAEEVRGHLAALRESNTPVGR